MVSVTQRVSNVKQPRGGYISPKNFISQELSDGMKLGKENLSPSLIGITVDYLTRVANGISVEDAFRISIKGAVKVNEYDYAIKLLMGININNWDSNYSIECACKLSGFDVAFRSNPINYKPVQDINPDETTINNIRIMVRRAVSFFNKYGPVIKAGFNFKDAYTQIIDRGDADFLTKDTLWDFKVSKSKPTSKQTLQLLIYYLMGKKSNQEEFEKITKIGIFNPRLNIVYVYNLEMLSKEVVNIVEKEIIGY